MKTCPHCNENISKYNNPYPTVDVVIYHKDYGIVLIERKNTPFGWALPGGFAEQGESLENAAMREMQEETSLDVKLQGILGVYSEPDRDPRFHTITITYVGHVDSPQNLCAGDDASKAKFYKLDNLPISLCFDHDLAVSHFKDYLAGKRPLLPINS